jgi:uncharacterized protein (TIGR02594 family)
MTDFEPHHLKVARNLIGTREAPGVANSATIMGWIKKLDIKVLGIAVNADSVPWCGTFAAYCVREAGLTPPPVAVRAKSWATWEANLRAEHLSPGAVLVFDREGGGHVGFYVGEDQTHYHVLGGNQSDSVNVMRILKQRCIARRWPRSLPVVGQPVKLNPNGTAVSRNEA